MSCRDGTRPRFESISGCDSLLDRDAERRDDRCGAGDFRGGAGYVVDDRVDERQLGGQEPRRQRHGVRRDASSSGRPCLGGHLVLQLGVHLPRVVLAGPRNDLGVRGARSTNGPSRSRTTASYNGRGTRTATTVVGPSVAPVAGALSIAVGAAVCRCPAGPSAAGWRSRTTPSVGSPRRSATIRAVPAGTTDSGGGGSRSSISSSSREGSKAARRAVMR